jgi:TPR repeat protein/RNA polymerase subunit RPABC4/transcription elongation factor Spt4
MPACSSCNAPLTENDRFCPHCGKAVEVPAQPEIEAQPSPRHCSNCGALLEEGAKFCGECGQPLTSVRAGGPARATEVSLPPQPVGGTFLGNRKYLALVLIGLVAAGVAILVSTRVIQFPGSKVNATRERANQGDVNAQFDLGRMYHNGQGVKQDYSAAADWFERAAKQNDARAEFNLGLIYLNGQGRNRSETEAVTWLKTAAAQGYAPAQTSLGMLYKQGTGVAQDNAQAAAWLLKAAKQGNADAQALLGSLYATGDGIPQNYTEAYRWLTLAARQGDPETSGQAEAIRKIMTLDQLAAATEFAKQPASAAPDAIVTESIAAASTPAAEPKTSPSSWSQATPAAVTSTPVPSSLPDNTPTTPGDLKQFIEEQWVHTQGNNAYQWSRDFARDADYCFTKGHPSDLRAFIAQDRTKFVERWPTRTYSSVNMNLKMISNDSARITYDYDYSYRGGSGRSTRGHCRQFLSVEKVNYQWQITKFDEKVDRY